MADDRRQKPPGGPPRRPLPACVERPCPLVPDEDSTLYAPNPVFILVMIAFGAVVCLMLLGFVLTAFLGSGRPGGAEALNDTPIPVPAAEVEDVEAKHRTVVAAFRAPAPTWPAAELAAIEQSLSRFIAAVTSEDANEFHDQINHRRMFAQVKRSGVPTSLTQRANDSGAQNVRSALELPQGFRRFRIADVSAGTEPEEVVVCLHVWREDDFAEPMRFWLAREGLGWKVFDWERLRIGLRRSTLVALQISPAMSPPHRALANIVQQTNQFDRLFREGNREQAYLALQQAQQGLNAIGPSIEADQARVTVADALLRTGQTVEAYALYKAVQSPEQVPGAVYGQAVCLYSASRAGRALVEINRFEQMLGPGPLVHRLRAELLTSLKRRSEASEEWIKVRQVDPEASVLESLAIALGPDQLDRLAEFLDRTTEPAAAAEALLVHYRIQNHFPIQKWLADYIESQHPDSARAFAAQATVSAAENDFEGAMRLMKQAIAATSDDEQRTGYVTRSRGYAWSAGKEQELLEGAEQAKEVFQQFVSDPEDRYEEREVAGSPRLRSFVQKFLERFPNDPDANFALGEMLQQEEKLPEAEVAFRKAAANAEPELEASITQRLQSIAIAQGKAIEQYRAAPSSEKFLELAEPLRWTTNTRYLADLVVAHRTNFPTDPSLRVYEAIVARNEGRFEDAYVIYRSMVHEVDPDTGQPLANPHDPTFRAGWLEAAAAAGRLREVYEEADPPGSAFNEVASQLRTNNDWSGLQQIIALHGQRSPGDPQIMDYQMFLDEGRGNHGAVVQTLQTTGRHLQSQNWQQYYGRIDTDRYFHSLLLLNRKAEAIDYARECDVRLLSDVIPALGLVAAEDVDALLAYVAGHSAPRNLVPRLYSDVELGRSLRTPAFRKFREVWPPRLATAAPDKRSIVLTSEVWMPPLAEFERLASKALGVAQVETLPQAQSTVISGGRFVRPPKDDAATRPISMNRFLVSHPHGKLLITFSAAPYVPEKNRTHLGLVSRRLLEGHRAWIGVADIRSSTTSQNEQSRLHGTMLASLLTHGGVGLYSENWTRLIPAGDQLISQLQADGLTEALFQGKRIEYLYSAIEQESDEAESEEDAEKEAALVTARIKSLAEAFGRRKESDRFRLQTMVTTGHATEAFWSTVTAVEAQEWGGYQFLVTLESASRLDPDLTPGEPFEIFSHAITDYEYTVDGKTHRASDQEQE